MISGPLSSAIQRERIHPLTVRGHLHPHRPTHLGRLGGGAFEYTVVVWPRAPGPARPGLPACLPAGVCALAPFGQYAAGCCQRLSFTIRRQLNSSCANTYTLNGARINDFMLEPLCGGGSDILRT